MHHVLIVDDESGIRESLSGVLEDEGYKASTAHSAEECLELLRKSHYDVVLLDIWLPGMDGLEALEKIKEFDDRPEVVMISGHGSIESAVQATKTMVTGIDDVGTPDAPQGEEAAQQVSDWADASVTSLEDAQDALDDEPDTLEQALQQLRGATDAIAVTLKSGVTTVASVASLDPALAAALRDSSTCQRLREKEQSS